MQYAITTSGNVAIGPLAFRYQYYNGFNVAAGYQAGRVMLYSSQGVALGYRSGYYAYGASCSVFIGRCAAYCGCRQCGAVVIGSHAGLRMNRCGSGEKGNVLIGYLAGARGATAPTGTQVGYLCCGCNLVAIGGESFFNAAAANTYICNQTVIGHCPYPFPTGNNSVTIGSVYGNTTYLCGCLSKTSGSFKIEHPEPNSKKKFLYHSFVESPNRGDNLYRYKFNVCNCEHRIKLPNYYKYLNECNMAWVYAVNHFGEGYAKVDKEDLVIKTNKDGCYNVLLMGTRCDPLAVRDWEGVETIG